jgi:lipoprotein NlpI
MFKIEPGPGVRLLAFAGALMVAMVSPAVADTAPAAAPAPADPAAEILKPCAEGPDAAARAVACTEAINGGGLTGKSLAAAYLLRGQAQAQRNELTAAVTDFSAALKIDGRSDDALYDRAQVYGLLGRGDLALEDFNRLLKQTPNDPDALAERAKLYAAQDKNEAAVNDLGAVLAQHSGDFEIRLQRAGLSIVLGRYEDAIKDCDALLQAAPKSPAALYNRGRAEFLKGDYAASAKDFGAAMRNRDNNPYAALRLYLAQAHMGKIDPAPLAGAAKAFPADQWPLPIVALYLGKVSDSDLLTAAAVSDPKIAANLVAESQYYLGAWALAKKDAVAARAHFRAALAAKGDRDNLEVIDATRELKRLGP